MSIILTGLLGVAKIAGGIITARVVGKGLNAIGERITPYNKSRPYKQAEQTAKNQKELELMRQAFQERQQQESIHAQKEITVFNRNTQMILAEKNAYSTLRHTLIQDAIRNFPLNISPLILLENNNIDISFLLGDVSCSDVESQKIDAILDGVEKIKPVNVFITPMHVDSRVSGKEVVAAQVFDAVYSSLESVFVNEYSRNGDRPIAFYSAAWNKNVKGGLHAADELFYFLKELPTIVVEPRFDGKTIKLMFSCWGIGYSSQIHTRQELQIPLDLNSMLALSAYERSKKALESVVNVNREHKLIKEQCATFEHNVAIFEELKLGSRIEKRLNEIKEFGKSTELDELGDYSRLLYINHSDIVGIADIISATTGMMIAVLSDTHHLLAHDVPPRFPHIYKTYFNDFVDKELLSVFSDMYERTYLKLSQEFPEQESSRLLEKEIVKKLLGTNASSQTDSENTIRDSLTSKCSSLGAEESVMSSWSITELLDYYIEHYDNDTKFRKSVYPFLSPKQQIALDNKILSQSL